MQCPLAASMKGYGWRRESRQSGVPSLLVDQILEMKATNCIVCHRNGPIDNLILDSPQTQGHSPCNHFCCTECWV